MIPSFLNAFLWLIPRRNCHCVVNSGSVAYGVYKGFAKAPVFVKQRLLIAIIICLLAKDVSDLTLRDPYTLG